MNLTADERRWYARHLLMPEVGTEGQKRLKKASVLIVGAGGLGCPAVTYLASAGVGHVALMDDDRVEVSNLHRQPLHSGLDIGKLKVESAVEKLSVLNPLITYSSIPHRLTAQNALQELAEYDLVINGADTFGARYLVNDACSKLGIPWVHGALFRFDGEVAFFPPGGPCYRCLHPNPPAPGESPSCAEAGVLGVLPGIVGTLMAAEALKNLLGVGENLTGKLLLVDTLTMRFRQVRIPRREGCLACMGQLVPTELEQDCAAPVANPAPMNEITPLQLKALQDAGEDFRLVDVREPHEWEIGHIDGAELVPLATVPAASQTWDPDERLIVMCRSGKRSGDAIAFLKQQGFTDLTNLAGGILAWSDQVDSSIPKY